jgi:hypothetical protein
MFEKSRLGVAGYPQNNRNNLIGYAFNLAKVTDALLFGRWDEGAGLHWNLGPLQFEASPNIEVTVAFNRRRRHGAEGEFHAARLLRSRLLLVVRLGAGRYDDRAVMVSLEWGWSRYRKRTACVRV